MEHKITRALISVSDKHGIVDFCHELQELGIEIIATGGTYSLLLEQAIAVTDVSAYTGFPELMNGRIKTLHPKIHGGILGRQGIDDGVMAEHGIEPIDIVVVNLYPFAQTVAKPDCHFNTAIETIDIGGPAMLRAAAKNHARVAVVVDPSDYDFILAELKGSQTTLCQQTRFNLAAKCFAHTAHYDSQIATYLYKLNSVDFPDILNMQYRLHQPLRYGENPHQKAAFYRALTTESGSLAAAKQWQGKALSFNNIADADTALACVQSLTGQPACVIVKHANPCGVAQADNLLSAYRLAYQTDPTSAFGGVIAFNQELDATTAMEILEQQFVEVIVVPVMGAAAKAVLANKPNVRVLECGQRPDPTPTDWDFKCVSGGLLVQEKDQGTSDDTAVFKVVSQRSPSEAERADLLFAWKIAQFVKSNAIVYCKNGQTIGIGAGQMSRVYSAKIAAIKAIDEGLTVHGSVMASDAFFPFRDSIDAAAEAGITAVIHPGGSLRDNEVIAAADEHGMAMICTGIRHFRH